MIHSARDGVVIDVRVIPRSQRPGIGGTRGDAVLVRLQSPPVDGAANAELIEVLSDALDVRRQMVTIVAGMASRQKRVHISGVDVATVRARLVPR